jgi:hypothetical protein
MDLKQNDFVALKTWPECLRDTRTSHFEAFVTRADESTVDVVFSNGQELKGLPHSDVVKIPNTQAIHPAYFLQKIVQRIAEHKEQYYHWARAQGMSRSSAKSPSRAALADYIKLQEFKSSVDA